MYTQTRYSIIDIQYYFICIPVIDLSSKQQLFLETCFSQILKNHSCKLKDISISYDQIHILFSMSINSSLKQIINILKSHSSFLLRKECPELKEYPSLWIKGYVISTIGVKNEKAAEKMMKKLKEK